MLVARISRERERGRYYSGNVIPFELNVSLSATFKCLTRRLYLIGTITKIIVATTYYNILRTFSIERTRFLRGLNLLIFLRLSGIIRFWKTCVYLGFSPKTRHLYLLKRKYYRKSLVPFREKPYFSRISRFEAH